MARYNLHRTAAQRTMRFADKLIANGFDPASEIMRVYRDADDPKTQAALLALIFKYIFAAPAPIEVDDETIDVTNTQAQLDLIKATTRAKIELECRNTLAPSSQELPESSQQGLLTGS